jgi:Protein of unknown function (DUF3631)
MTKILSPLPQAKQEAQSKKGPIPPAKLDDLANLSPAQYGQKRQSVSDEYGIQLKFLDQEYEQRRRKARGSNGHATTPPVPEELIAKGRALAGSTVLSSVYDFLGRFVAYPSVYARIAHTLWCAHTHLMDVWDSTPRIAFMSPTKKSGKSRALEVTALLVPRPVHAVNVSPAYLFRKVADEAGRPAILYDEVDNLFGSKDPGKGDVIALLSAGHRKGAVAGRCVVVDGRVTTEEIEAYAGVALAGLRNLPDTLSSRSVFIGMRRRTRGEKVEPLRIRIRSKEAQPVFDNLAAWCASIESAITGKYPEIPAQVTDRDADCWECLLTIADAAGNEWPTLAREAAVFLVERGAEHSQTQGIQLLSDLYVVFKGVERMSTAVLLGKLHNLPESEWNDMKDTHRPLTDRGLAEMLRDFEIKPKKHQLRARRGCRVG